MRVLFSLIVLLFLAGFSSLPTREEVTQSSVYLGRTFVTNQPLAYITGLPRFNEVSRYVRRNTRTLFADEVDRRITKLRNNCPGCIGSDRISTPIRIEYIPVGTSFSVIDEYLYDVNSLFSSPIHRLIVRDNHGNMAEISELAFKHEIATPNTGKDRITSGILRNLESFSSNDPARLSFCLHDFVEDPPDLAVFISDFQLSAEMTYERHEELCMGGYIFEFKTPEAYLTSTYYFKSWGLYGKWFNYFSPSEAPVPPMPRKPPKPCGPISLSDIKHPNDLGKLCKSGG